MAATLASKKLLAAAGKIEGIAAAEKWVAEPKDEKKARQEGGSPSATAIALTGPARTAQTVGQGHPALPGYQRMARERALIGAELEWAEVQTVGTGAGESTRTR